jgi:hypothetical protein
MDCWDVFSNLYSRLLLIFVCLFVHFKMRAGENENKQTYTLKKYWRVAWKPLIRIYYGLALLNQRKNPTTCCFFFFLSLIIVEHVIRAAEVVFGILIEVVDSDMSITCCDPLSFLPQTRWRRISTTVDRTSFFPWSHTDHNFFFSLDFFYFFFRKTRLIFSIHFNVLHRECPVSLFLYLTLSFCQCSDPSYQHLVLGRAKNIFQKTFFLLRFEREMRFVVFIWNVGMFQGYMLEVLEFFRTWTIDGGRSMYVTKKYRVFDLKKELIHWCNFSNYIFL